jgi:hypothetical protein
VSLLDNSCIEVVFLSFFKLGVSRKRAVGFRDNRFTLISSEDSKAGRHTGRITYEVYLVSEIW